MPSPLSLFDRVWARHVIVANPGGEELLFVDRNLVHEDGTFLAFDQMRIDGHKVRKLKQTLAVTDHYLPSTQRATAPASIANTEIRRVVELLDENAREFGIEHFGVHDPRQGIIHVVGPELGWTQPGLLIACCDSHTATHGALGALPIPIGQSNQLRHVLATQTIWQKKPATMRIIIDGALPAHVTAKDVILALIARIGIGGAVGHAVEYAGSTLRGMSMEGRMTICNMSIEAGARIGMIAQLHAAPGATMTVDLAQQSVVAPDGTAHPFDIDGSRKERLLKGLDDVGVTLQYLAQIEAFEAQYRADMPWLAHMI